MIICAAGMCAEIEKRSYHWDIHFILRTSRVWEVKLCHINTKIPPIDSVCIAAPRLQPIGARLWKVVTATALTPRRHLAQCMSVLPTGSFPSALLAVQLASALHIVRKWIAGSYTAPTRLAISVPIPHSKEPFVDI